MRVLGRAARTEGSVVGKGQKDKACSNQEEKVFALFGSGICALYCIYCVLHCGLPPRGVIRNTGSGRHQH